MTGPTLRWRRPTYSRRGLLGLVLLAAVAWAVATAVASGSPIRSRGWSVLAEIVGAAFTPDLSPAFLRTLVADAMVTIAYAVGGMTIAVVIGVPAGVAAAGVLGEGPLAAGGAVVTRVVLAMVRSMHELVWALLLIAGLGLSPWVGLLAIGLPYGGIVGRILGDRLQDVPEAPLRALESTGATSWGVLLFGRIASAGADIASYLAYRFECAVRTAAVLSFVGLGGLGFRLEIALDDLAFDRVWTVVYVLVLLVVGIDRVAGLNRARLTR